MPPSSRVTVWPMPGQMTGPGAVADAAQLPRDGLADAGADDRPGAVADAAQLPRDGLADAGADDRPGAVADVAQLPRDGLAYADTFYHQLKFKSPFTNAATDAGRNCGTFGITIICSVDKWSENSP